MTSFGICGSIVMKFRACILLMRQFSIPWKWLMPSSG